MGVWEEQWPRGAQATAVLLEFPRSHSASIRLVLVGDWLGQHTYLHLPRILSTDFYCAVKFSGEDTIRTARGAVAGGVRSSSSAGEGRLRSDNIVLAVPY